MNTKASEIIIALARYNAWRRGDETIEMPDSKQVGAMIDDAVALLGQEAHGWAPFSDMECLARLLAERGFQLARGTWEHEGLRFPSVVITRPEVPQWLGVWGAWDPDDAEGWSEAQTALGLAGRAIEKWQREFVLYARPNADVSRAP